ncbi:LytTR family DNA-binding domain-containing protein [Gramella jeungdoensis]|uniref:LytTR family DNA-binding domain-containing protein n=1 Tax=Gramella jeungdoensis TaxID=708091 RepID=A0ABT0YZL9_9FLAO|nr:LytTR family DNA-binding domain-containing protein [Gramella jeungdoensis]MCM8568923.1 LytTR family DNA-binding domain-containing protein [Gramella jeungdoensis]
MRIVIIEDEIFAAEALQKIILELRPDTKIMARLASIEEAVAWFGSNEMPQLIFCDIHLSDGSSFEIFKEIEIKSPVIFTTAYNEYAIEAFKVNSVDYLLKPLKKEEILKAIEKYEELKQDKLSEELQNLQNLLQTQMGSNSGNNTKSRFMVKSGQSIKTISSKDVAYFQAEEGIVLLVNFKGNRFAVNYTLDQLENQLDHKTFFRANRQLIVNIRAVKEVHPYFKGRLQLKLDPASEKDHIISSSKASAFKEWLDL